MMPRSIDPRPLSETQGQQAKAGEAASWHQRGVNLASASLEEWPFIDWEKVSVAAHCFTIAGALGKDRDDA